MKRELLCIVMFVSVQVVVFAQKETIGGITYKVKGDVARVVAIDESMSSVTNILERVTIKNKEYPVTTIGDWNGIGFSRICLRNKNLVSISIPNFITRIERHAFVGCDNLREVILPNTPFIIRDGYLSKDILLSSTVPRPNEEKGTTLFSECKQLSVVRCQDGSFPAYIFSELSPQCPFVYAYQKEEREKANRQYVIVQQPVQMPQQAPAQQQVPATVEQSKAPSSDVDVNLPNNPATNENTFAVILANENYQEEVKVEYALNDGEIFKEYCGKVLGIPEDNIHIRKDATRNNLIAEVAWMQKVAEAYKGEARFVVYYAGHGIPDEKSGSSYLLPVDGKGSMLETGYSLQQFYKQLGEMPSSGVVVFMDACFSGSKRGDGMLASARGVAIKAKAQEPKGKMVVFSAAQSDETAYPLKDKEHGLFTYYLLKKLKDTQGNVTLGELSSYVSDQVSKKSIVSNGKSQTPSVSHSSSMNESWKTLKLK